MALNSPGLVLHDSILSSRTSPPNPQVGSSVVGSKYLDLSCHPYWFQHPYDPRLQPAVWGLELLLSPLLSAVASVWNRGAGNLATRFAYDHVDLNHFCYLGWKIEMIKLFFFSLRKANIVLFAINAFPAKLWRVTHPAGTYLSHSADSSH